jgi:hypothetical protein
VAELTLNQDQRNSLVRHLDRVCVTQLVWRETAPHASPGGRLVRLLAGGGRFPAAPCRRAMDHAQHRAGSELAADLKPRLELLPRPTIHPDLATLAALPAPDKDGAAGPVQIALLERERFADP